MGSKARSLAGFDHRRERVVAKSSGRGAALLVGVPQPRKESAGWQPKLKEVRWSVSHSELSAPETRGRLYEGDQEDLIRR